MRRVTIDELKDEGAITFGDGYRTKRSEHGAPGYRILRVADVRAGTVMLDGPDFVSRERTTAIGRKLSRAGDVLVTTKGTVGRVAIMPEGVETVVYSPQLCYFRVLDSTVVHPRYLAYWFRSPAFSTQATHRANNTDMAAYINLADIASLELRLPKRSDQLRIAEVLGALDDKIAANDRVLRRSLSLADVEYARRARGLVAGPLTFADVADVSGGGTPKTSVDEYWGGGVAWTTPTDVTALRGPYLDATSRTLTEAGLANCSSKLHPAGSILMTSRATIGAFAIAQVEVAVNQGFIVVNAKDPRHQWWLFHEMRSRVEEFIANANGATFLELPRGRFKLLPVRMSEMAIVNEFDESAERLHGIAAGMQRESATLARTRDELLPLLMSGTLRVKDAEKQIEEVL